jgi:hypothetical protein
MDALLNTFRLYFNRLANTLNVLFGPMGASSLETPYAMLMSDQDQMSAGVTAVNTVTYNQTVLARGIEVQNGSEIWFERAGQYLVTITLQATNRGNTPAMMDVWARSNGMDYPLSNARYDLQPRKSSTVWSHIVPSISGIFTVADPSSDFMSLKWWSDSADVFLEHYPAEINPARPEVASVVVNITCVSRLPSMP